jgi:hypothetical protein
MLAGSTARARFVRRFGAAVAATLLIGATGTVAFGQYRNQASRSARHYADAESFDGKFQFCRIQFRRASNGDGNGWDVDFPRADQNLSTRLSELTKAPVSFDERHEPNHLLLTLDQPEIFKCGFMMMTEVGSIYLDDREALNLRNYLLKGGFLWADDFWGDYAWAIWESQIRKALPSSAYPIIDLPLDHPFFHLVLHVDHFPQIPGIGATDWRHGQTSERGAASATPHARAILDQHGRVMVLITHNTDFGDAYEREEDDPEYFRNFSVIGYAFGINVLVYLMTH